MYCKNCGHELVEGADVCLNCGKTVKSEQSSVVEKKSNALSIIGFILSFFIPIAGLICSIIGLKKAKELGSGRGLAIAGIVISIVNWFLGAVMANEILDYYYF